MQVDGKVYKVIFLEKATITECNMKIKQYSSDMHNKNFCLDMWDFICFTKCKVTSKNLKKGKESQWISLY
jgi:hypothetical protein